ncbi:MAG TPA: protein kinase, partial [Thermoanaerobaculia bacterium]|nr:protein kinase [Thermoanaerobaculia bacterium]
GGGPQTNFPTAAASAETEPGVVLGTLGYMSPEQVRGRPADARSDIFSFGAILYEMLSGKRAFHRDTAADTMSAILREDPPDLSSTNRQVSPALDRIIRHCLEKDPEARFHSAHDLAFQLQIPPAEDSASLPAAEPARVRLRPVTMVGTAILLLLAGTLAVLLLRHPRGERAAQTVRFSIPIPPGTTYAPSEISRGVSISPDGTRIVVEAISNGRPRLFARPLDLEKFTELEGSVGARAHFWSPDGRFIAFYADGKLKKIPAAGGPAEELCSARYEFVGTWSREGTILFAEIPPAAPGIYSVSDKGGEPVRILAPDPARPSAALWPQFLPDGRRYLYQSFVPGGPEAGRRHQLRVASLDTKETRTIVPLLSRFEYAEPGYLFYVRDNALFVQPFDEKRTVPRGEPILLADGVRHFFGPGNASFSISHTGAVVYEAAQPPVRLAWFDRQGREIGTLGQPAVVKGLRISPEGGRVAVDVLDSKPGTSDLWLYELASGVSTRLNAGQLDEVQPVWSPDGTKLIFRSDEKGPPDVHEMVVGSPGSERPVLEQPGVQEPADVSPNGRLLVYLEDAATTPDIWLRPLEGDRKPRPWVRSPFNERSPRFSPDGRWIAYESDESGTPEVYVALTDGAGEKKRLSPGGGRHPRWRRGGSELYYVAPDGSVMAIPITPGPGLETGSPMPLFHVETDVENFDVVPDGSRFLVSTRLDRLPESPLRVILNWEAALKAKNE